MNEIIAIENDLVKTEINPADVFVPGGLDILINTISAKAEEEAEGLSPNTDKGRKEFWKICRKISSSKVFIETAMKNYVADLKARIKPVDAERIRFVTEMDSLRDKIDKPRQEWQAKEDAKIAAANAIMKELQLAAVVYADTTAEELAKRIEQVEEMDVNSLPEDYLDNAARLQDETLAKLYQQHDEVVKREAEAVELAKLRADAAAREEADRKAKEEKERLEREERLKAEAAAKATREAEEKAAAEKKSAEEAIAKAKKDAEDAEARRVAQEEESRLAQIKAVEETIRKAKEESDRKERERLAEIEKQRIADEKRAANKKHREKIRKESILSLIDTAGLNEEQAATVFSVISSGVVAHIKVEW